MVDKSNRLAFADFIDRLISQKVDNVEWQKFAIAHYLDELLEDVRREVVRLSINSPTKIWSESEIKQLHKLAQELR